MKNKSLVKKFQEKPKQYKFKPLTEQNWKAYKSFYISMERPEFIFNDVEKEGMDTKEEQEKGSSEKWKNVINAANDRCQMFALWNKENILGHAGLWFKEIENKKHAVFDLIEISDKHRKQGLSGKLYHGLREYLQTMDFNGPIIVYVAFENKKGLKAAIRNGFAIEKNKEDGYSHGLIYQGFCSLKNRPSYTPGN